MPTCPNTSYVSDEVYKCKFCCSSKVSYILLNVIIMQLSYIMSTLFHFPPQIQVVLVTTACLKNRTYHSIPSLFMLKYMERLFNFNVYKKNNILQIWRLQQIWRHVYSINHRHSSRHHVYTSRCPNSCHRLHAAENVE